MSFELGIDYFKNGTFSRGIDYNMSHDKCYVELKADKKHVWVLDVPEECREVIDDIRSNQGPYGRKYLDVRMNFAEKPILPMPSTEMVPQEPPTIDASTDIAE